MSDDLDSLRRQWRHLKSLRAELALDDVSYQEQRAALEARMLQRLLGDDAPLPDAAAAPAGPRRPPRATLMALALLVAAGAGYGLGHATAPQGAGGGEGAVAAAAAPAASAPHAMNQDQIAALATATAARLEKQPDDADGWATLARSYTVLGRNADALSAYERAVALRGDDAALLADQADALAVRNGRRVSGEPFAVVQRALRLDPDQPKALALAGTAAFEQKNYAEAVRLWERLVQTAPAGDGLAEQIRGSIDEARQLGQLPAAAASPAASPASPAALAGGAIEGSVSLAPALAARARPDDTLFVFARPAEGSRMPLAVLRKQVRDLPLRFRLDDSLAMTPAAKLSGATRVIVGARISRSGSAVPAPDDLHGQSGPVAPGASGLTIVISETSSR